MKDNARILKNLELIEYGSKNNPKSVILTDDGKIVLHILIAEGKIELKKR